MKKIKVLKLLKKPFINCRYKKVKNKDISIISNNCIGANISGKLGLRFNSPTVNLQILPRQYVKFISNLDYYMGKDVVELVNPTEQQKKMIYELYGKTMDNLEFPFGIIDDIVICFQHYRSFDDAVISWNRRKNRICKKAYVFIVDAQIDRAIIEEYCELDLNNKLLFIQNDTKNFPAYLDKIKQNTNTKVIKFVCPKDVHFMKEYRFMKSYYERNFDSLEWINSLE